MCKSEPNTSISKLCYVLELAASFYYYTPVVQHEEKKTKTVMKNIHESNCQAYGKRRMLRALRKEKFNIGLFKVSRLIKKFSLVAKRSKKTHYYPVGKKLPNIPNFIDRSFEQLKINTHQVEDITYRVPGVQH